MDYGFLSFAKNIGKNLGKNISKNISGKYSQKLLDQAKQSTTNALKTTSKSSEEVRHRILQGTLKTSMVKK